MDILPVVPFLSGILIYNTTNLLLKAATARFFPTFFRYLEADRNRRLEPYLAFVMGWLITLFSAPICTVAAIQSKPEASLFDTELEHTLLEKICVGSRVVLWVGETPRLEFSGLYTAHHGLSIAAFLSIIHVRAPRQQLYVLYAALATELVSTAIAVLKIHGWKVNNSRFLRSATYWNVALLILVRLPTTLWCIWLVLKSEATGVRVLANLVSLLLYMAYQIYCISRQVQSLSNLKEPLSKTGSHDLGQRRPQLKFDHTRWSWWKRPAQYSSSRTD
jgi:hypothetical protein